MSYDIRVPLPQFDRTGGRVIITSPYGMRWGRLHGGVDLGTTDGIEVGTPVTAPVDGRVVSVLHNPSPGSEGRNMWLLGDDGSRWKFFHLNRVSAPEGTSVRAGMQIAEVGMTGTSAPHLHFEQHIGSWSNPVDCTELVRDAIRNNRWGLQPVTPPPPPPPTDWFDDMATKQELKDAIREVLAEDDVPVFVAETNRFAALVAFVADATGVEVEWDQGTPKVKR